MAWSAPDAGSAVAASETTRLAQPKRDSIIDKVPRKPFQGL